MIEIGQARQLLIQAVHTKGVDFVYKQAGENKACYYVPMNGTEWDFKEGDPRNETGCLIGVALSLSDQLDGRDLHILGNVSAITYLYPDLLSTDTTRYFQVAQSRQDKGATWGEAYEAAEEFAKTRLCIDVNSDNQ